MSTATTQYAVPHLEEHFTWYTLHWNLPVQTDTPDLMGALDRAKDNALLAQGAAAQADEDAQLAEADMGVGFETLTD